MKRALLASSSPLSPGDALDASRVDAHRLLRPPLLAADHHHCLLTPSLAAAMAVRGTAGPLSRSTRDRSALSPSRVSAAATAWRSPCHGSGQAQPEAPARSHAADKRCDRRGTAPVAAAY